MSLIKKKNEFNVILYNINGKSFSVYVFETKDKNLWFKAREIGLLLEYKRPKDAIKYHVAKKNKVAWRDLIHSQTLSNSEDVADIQLPSNWQPHSIFINKTGLHELVSHSKQSEAIPLFQTFLEISSSTEYNILEDNVKLTKKNPIDPIDKSGFIYIATSDAYKEDNAYKIGCTKNPSSTFSEFKHW
ncbi:putative Bro-N domain-containing protein 5 [Diachasmimorpha longicaudata entomopoxvirus]|uniref:Putative Bro-N domain-containing protein 5 n=1 Tax=Diachasmimorpha longicaudata entomopoxvirus TaxID=109981 RepID=A0A7R5WF82_9POXV|nr:putative Bro-N domain-containing protein 5 [Diachasmimorpha longicaudata entomopoxvirus]AKS26375.1 putative Bro-N domain-containing protein 5 [Diachasmimorpha longicaudata entomopoxvirus]